MKLNNSKSNFYFKVDFLFFGKLIAILFFLFFSIGKMEASNITFDSANEAYGKGDFGKAIKLYESIASKDNLESAELYYNLGNAYYKLNNISLAILNYERAKKLNPNDDDVNYNLKLANQKIEDKIEVAPQLFLNEWKNGIVDLMNEKAWSLLCVFMVVLVFLFFCLYLSSNNNNIKKLGFFGGLLFFTLAIFVYFMAENKYNLTKFKHDAIITSAAVTVTGSPNENGTKLFVLHEGTKLSIIQEEEEWFEVKIANGNVGWVKSNTITAI